MRKWTFKLGFIVLGYTQHTYLLHFGIFKLMEFPTQGATIDPSKYKGFWWRKEITIKGFEITT